MPDPETKIRLTGEDKTGPVIKKVGDAFRSLNKDVQAMFKETADKTLISIDQIAKRTMMQSSLSAKERLQRVEETSRALHGVIQKNISASNTMAQELNRQNIEAAKAGKVMRTSQEAAGDAAVKSADKAVKSTRSWVATNADLHKFFLKSKEAATDAGNAGADAGDKAGRAHGKANAIVEAGVGALSKMAIGYFSVSKAIDVAKNSFMGFAEMDDKMRLLRGSANLTHKQTEEFAEVIKRTARSVGEDTKEMADAFKVMGDTAGLSYDQIVKIYPQVALMAKGAGVTVGQMSRLVSDTLRNLNIAPEKAGEAMEIMSGGMRKLNVDIGQMGPHMNEITADMTELGYTGVDALTEITAIMGSLNKITGNTTESAEVFQRLLGTVSSEWKNMGFASEQSMMRYLKASDSPMAALVDLIRQSKNQEELFAGMNIRQRRALRQLLKEDNAAIIGDNKRTLAELAKSHEGEKAALERMAGPMQELNKLIVILDQLGEQFGELMDDFGATTAIKNLTDILDNLRRDLKWLHEFWNFAFRGGEAPKPRFSKEEIEEQQKKPFYDRLPMIARPLGEWFTKGMQGPFGAWGPLYGGGGGDGHGPPAATPQSHTAPAQTPVDALGQRVRYVSSALAGPTGSQGSREVYGTSTDAKYLTANYMPSRGDAGVYGGGGGGDGTGTAYSGVPSGGGIGTAPADMAPAGPGRGRGGTGYDGGTTLAPPSTGRTAADQGVTTPRGSRERISTAKAAMKDELIKQGVSPEKAEEGANLLAGQALSESELNPTLSHDQGTGHGIYGARLDRRAAMFDWLDKHGYDRNSLTGQSRYMAVEALSKDKKGRFKYPGTAAALANADPASRSANVTTLTKEFEAPADQGPGQMSRRLGRTQQAAGIAPGDLPTGPAEPQAAGAAGGPEAPGVATGNRVMGGRDLRGTDPRITEIVGAAAEALPAGYKIAPTSGVRTAGQGQHTHGRAQDWQIIGPDGKAVPNRGDDKSGLYTKLARAAYGYQEKYHPDLTGKFQWGGQFGTSAKNPNEPDLMHFDIGGRRGRIGRYSREAIGSELPPRPGAAPPSATAGPAAPAAPSPEATTPPDARAPADTGLIQSQNRDINMNVNVNSSQVQFARNTIDRQVYASLDRSRGNSYHDITTA